MTQPHHSTAPVMTIAGAPLCFVDGLGAWEDDTIWIGHYGTPEGAAAFRRARKAHQLQQRRNVRRTRCRG